MFVLVLAAAAAAATTSAIVSGPSSASTGQPLAFDGSASTAADGGPLAYAWSIDGQDLDVMHAWLAVSFAHAGHHVVALTVTDAAGHQDTAQQPVDVEGDDRSIASLSPLPATVGAGTLARPELMLQPSAVRLRRHRLRVDVRCHGTARCAGVVRAVALVGRRHQPVLLARRGFTVTSGAPRVLHLRLSRAARRRLHRATLVRVTAYRGTRVRTATIWATSRYRVPVVRRTRR
jgi:PKD domain